MGKFKSETAKCRPRLLQFCQGKGVDVGCGVVEKITPDAIGVDARSGVADHVGPIDRLDFILTGTLDYVFSSHALEHMPFPVQALKEWMRTLRPGGHLVLYLPHREHYNVWNPEHYFNPSPEVVKAMVEDAALSLGRPFEVVHEFLDVGDDRYSFDLVVKFDPGAPVPVRPLRVFMRPEGFDGSSYLRARWPAEWLEKTNLAETRVTEAGRREDIAWAEICVFQRATEKNGGLKLWRMAGELGKKRVYDADDDLFRHPYVLGRPYYTDADVKSIRIMVEEADLVTCSTPGVARAMQEYAKMTAVLPNGVNPPLFDLTPNRHPGEVRLGFVAAPAHDEDFALIAPAVANILRRYGHVRLVFQGHVPAGANVSFRGDEVIRSSWVSYINYPATLMKLGIDILLVPWADTPFNHGKSLGKWLDGAYMSAAVIATPISDYASVCRHDETALLVNDPNGWEAAIESLVLDPEKRARLAAAARQEVKETLGYDVLAPRWASTYRAVLEGSAP